MYLFTLYINTWYTLLKVYLKIGLSFQSKKTFINFVNHTAPRILIMQNFKIHHLCFEKKRRTKCFIKLKIFLPSQNYNDNLHEKGKPLSTIEQSYIG